MEKQSEQRIDEFTRRVVEDGGLHTPSPGFMEHVMQAIETDTKTSRVYKPLITGKGWIVLLLVLAGCASLLYFFPMGGESQWVSEAARNNIKQYLSFGDALSGITFSKTLAYCVGVMALFLFQIPLLRQYLLKRYE